MWMWRVEYEQGSATALSNTHNTQREREAAVGTDQSHASEFGPQQPKCSAVLKQESELVLFQPPTR